MRWIRQRVPRPGGSAGSDKEERPEREEVGKMILSNLVGLLKAGAVLLAAILLGNWFLAALRTSRAQGKPWYAVYLSLPGILVVLAILLPVFFWLAVR